MFNTSFKFSSHVLSCTTQTAHIDIKRLLLLSFVLTLSSAALPVYSADNMTGIETGIQNDAKLLDDYINAKGYTSVITFDSSNIKQFWIDKSVWGKNGNIIISLQDVQNKGWESIPQKIQLANVNEAQNCKIDVVTEMAGMRFAILDSNNKVLSTSASEDDFIQYHIVSSTFQLEKTPDFSFMLKFAADSSESIPIKKIVLSFSNNKDSKYLSSPGVLKIDQNNVTLNNGTNFVGNSFTVTGKHSQIISNKRIISTNNAFKTSVKVKNIGNEDIRLYVGFAVYTKQGIRLDARNFPYKENSKALKVISAEEGSNTIIVDSYQEWCKYGSIALDENGNLSDIPSTSLIDGRIVEMKELENGQGEITLDKPLKNMIKEGTNIRIQGKGGEYLYTNYKVLKPGEEEIFTSSIQKDDNCIKYSSEAFPQGTYYVVPLILSYVTGSAESNTVQISDFSVSY